MKEEEDYYPRDVSQGSCIRRPLRWFERALEGEPSQAHTSNTLQSARSLLLRALTLKPDRHFAFMQPEWDNREDNALLNGVRLFRHIAEKGFQLGSVLGIGIVSPITYYRLRRRTGGAVGLAAILTAVGRSAVAGVGLATVLGAVRVATIPTSERAAGLQDRAYRLHYNAGQNRTDTFAELGMAIGGTASMLFVSPAAAVVLGGAAVGAAAGIVMHVATAEPGKVEG